MRLASLRRDGGTPLAVLTDKGLALAGQCAERLGLGGTRVMTMAALLDDVDTGLEIARAVEAATNDGDSRLSDSPLIAEADASFAPPVPAPEKIVCVGQNYMDHCLEQGKEPPERPLLFAKYATTLIGHGETIRIPREVSTNIDFEAELALVIGKRGKDISQADAFDHVLGYMCLNDITARDIQKGDGQWLRGKSFDTFAPCGPYLITADEVPAPQNLKIGCDIDGVVMQDSNTSNLIFTIPVLLEFMTKCFTLKPGDIISTGTPPGVGAFRDPPRWLQAGETVSVEVESLGRLSNPLA